MVRGKIPEGYTQITQDVIDERDEICTPLLCEPAKKSKVIDSISYFCYHQVGYRPYAWQHMFWKELRHGNKDILINTIRQAGKAQPLYSKVMTPDGFVNMGELQVGDYVIGSDGLPAEITNIYPQGVIDNYRLTFDDGSTTECAEDHLWKYHTATQRHKNSNKWEVDTLGYIYNRYYKYGTEKQLQDKRISIPVVEPVQFEEQKHYIDPYTMGALLGDGCLTHHCSFSTVDTEIFDYFENDFKINHADGCNYRIVDKKIGRKSVLLTELNRLGLRKTNSFTKFIPDEYLYDSVENRIKLIRGMMDTDGSIYGRRTMEYSTGSKKLMEGFKFLIESIGGKCIVKKRNTSSGKSSYRCYPRHNEINLFKLKRKADLWYPTKHSKERILHKIEHIGKEDMQCIKVDNEDHTYLTDNFIVTHNTFSIEVAALYYVLYNIKPVPSKGYTIVGIASSSEDQQMKIISDIRDIMAHGDAHLYDYSGGKLYKWFTTHLSQKQVDTNNKKELTFRERKKNTKTNQYEATGKIIGKIKTVPATKSARGNTFSLLFMDEAAFFDEDDFYDTVARPTLKATQGISVVTTTPNGQRGWFFKVFDPFEQLEYNPFYRMWLHYEHIEDDVEYMSVLEQKKRMYAQGADKKFQQEYEAMFTADDISFFDSNKVDEGIDYGLKLEPDYNKPTDLGVDIGVRNSKTIITISRLGDDGKIRLVYHYVYPAEKDMNLIEDIKKLIPQYNIQRVIIDDCAAASAFIQQARAANLNLHPMNFKKDKQTKYFQFKHKLYDGLIKYYDNKQLVSEMKALTSTEQQHGTKICKPSGGSDDFIDSFLMSTYFMIEDKKGFRILDMDDIE